MMTDIMKTGKTLLIVDDLPSSILMIEKILQAAAFDFNILTADDAESALEISCKELPDIIITDWHMPNMSGLELISELKNNSATKDIPVIMCTGKMLTSEDLKVALNAGAFDFMRKPIDGVELEARIHSALRFSQTLTTAVDEREQFLAILDIIPEEIYISDCETSEIVFANKAWKNAYLIDYEGKKCHEVIHNKNERCETCQNSKLFNSTGQRIKHEEYNKTTKKHYSIFEEIILWHNAKKAKFRIAFDISNLKHTVQALKESETKYRFFAESINDVIWVYNIDRERFTYVSRSIYNMRGYTVEEALSQDLTEALVPESRKNALRLIAERLEIFKQTNKKLIYYDEFIQPCKNGGKIWVETSASFRYNETGEVEILGVSRNIDTRKKLETELLDRNAKLTEINIKKDQLSNTLAETNTKLRAILDNSLSIIYLKDTDLNYTMINKQYQNVFGIKERDIIGKSDYDIHPKHIADKFRDADKKVFEKHKIVTVEEKAEYAEKTSYYLSTKFLLYNSQQEAYALCGISIDITKLKEREVLLKESEEKYRVLFEKSDDAILLIEGNRFISCNEAAVKLFKYKNSSELMQKGPHDISPQYQADGSPSMDKAAKNIQKALDKGTEKFEWLHQCSDGNTFPADVWLTSISVRGRNIIHAVVRDLSKQKAAENALKESEQKFNSIVANANEGIFIVQDGVFKFVNKYAAECVGLEQEELIGRSFSDFAHPEDLHKLQQKYDDRIARKEMVSKYAYRYITQSKEVRWGELSSILHKWNNEPAVLSFFSDITQRKQTEQALQHSYRELQSLNESIANQKNIIEKSYQNITDSINYAQYIQSALLPSERKIKEMFNEHFVLFKPKSGVSGDFYFAKNVNNFVVFAVGDCTGHGVAGALLSALSISVLNESSKRPETYTPDYMLELLRGKIKNTFKQFGPENHNGLDIALCILDTQSKLLQFAGAFSPLILIRNNQLKEFRGTRNPIGFYPAEKRFENNEIQLQSGDLLYLFSDGYYDQIGGTPPKKYTRKAFKNTLLEIQEYSMTKQKQILEQIFEERTMDLFQIDDVTIMGVRI